MSDNQFPILFHVKDDFAYVAGPGTYEDAINSAAEAFPGLDKSSIRLTKSVKLPGQAEARPVRITSKAWNLVVKDESAVVEVQPDLVFGTGSSLLHASTVSDSSTDDDARSTSTAPSSVESSPRKFSEVKLPFPFRPVTIDHPERTANPLPESFGPLPVSVVPIDVSPADVNTPDKWVKRNPNLVRLTGKHPLNAEVPINEMYKSGFLTPQEQFYVRSHGAVPTATSDPNAGETWRVRVHGLVQTEVSFTVAELKSKFETVSLPVTLVCAGNRRKEQNTHVKGLGFNWGPSGVSNALFTGVYLADVLDYVKPKKGAKHVIFGGGDSLPNGPYGTSEALHLASDRKKGMLLAWAMNGLPLEPDHGFPLRVVVPGHVGGRSVKWLSELEISENESQHYLHFHDNKVLPSHVTPDMARAEKHWWHNNDYIIYDLNVNSAIAQPMHEEVVEVKEDETYSIEGYAYSGGGKRVTRAEISLDEGDTWMLAKISYPEDKYRTQAHWDPIYGKIDLTESHEYYSWCFWKIEIPIATLADTDVICLRCMDEGLALQPRDMYWNATGMMNNWWFRVAIHRTDENGKTHLRFEHPTVPGAASGGWMERMKEAGEDYLKPVFKKAKAAPKPIETAPTVIPGPTTTAAPPAPSEPAPEVKPAANHSPMVNPAITRKITMEEVQAQDKSKPWFVIEGQVYDATPYLQEHPGGEDSILLVAGEDATEDFMAIHSPDSKRKLSQFHIGTLVTEKPVEEVALVAPPKVELPTFLSKTQWKATPLVKVTRVSHDSCIYKFAFPDADQRLGLPTGQHVFIRLRRKGTGELVQRAYTPVSRENDRGHIEFLIKHYLPCPPFPQGGKMSVGLHELNVGEQIELKGPLGSFVWLGKGVAQIKGQPREVKNLGLACGGSGITPMLQVLRAVLEDPSDTTTKIWLLFANKTEQDVLCREELEKAAKDHPDRVKVHFTIEEAPPTPWTGSIGRVSDAMLTEHFPSNGPDSLALFCGPEPMVKFAIAPGLERLGWDVKTQLVLF